MGSGLRTRCDGFRVIFGLSLGPTKIKYVNINIEDGVELDCMARSIVASNGHCAHSGATTLVVPRKRFSRYNAENDVACK